MTGDMARDLVLVILFQAGKKPSVTTLMGLLVQ